MQFNFLQAFTMRPNISEFSYGYALTEELVRDLGAHITAAPVFPSLYREGQSGGGWDMRLDRPTVPLFLQFKLADRLSRKSAKEYQAGLLSLPYFRMHLRPQRYSHQHKLLLKLEQKGQEVYYCAPAFCEPTELNAAYLKGQMRARSLWLRPSQIGQLPDKYDHYVAFRHPGKWVFCSDPVRGKGSKDYEGLVARVTDKLKTPTAVLSSRAQWENLAKDVAAVAESRPDIPDEDKADARKFFSEAPPQVSVAYYSAVYLECRLFALREIINGETA